MHGLGNGLSCVNEAGAFNPSAGHELLLGGRVLLLQAPRRASSYRRHCDAPLRIGGTLLAGGVALVARTCAARTRFDKDLRDGVAGVCGRTTIAGIWKSARKRRKFGCADGL